MRRRNGKKSEWLLMIEARAKDIKAMARSRDPRALEWLKKIVLDKKEHPGVRIRALSEMKKFDSDVVTVPLLETIRCLDDSFMLSNEARKILASKISLLPAVQEESEKAVAGKGKI